MKTQIVRAVSALLGSFAIGLGPAPVRAAAPARPSKPNVVIVLTDDQGYGDMSCHGNPVFKTPNMDRLHAESVRFTDFHVAPMCTPTRSQLMTGVDALRNAAMKVNSGRAFPRRELPLMPQIFAAAGYATGQFGKWHLGDNYPYRPQDRGFQESVWFPASHIGSAPDFWDNDRFDDTFIHNGRRQHYDGYEADVFFTEAMKWMRAQAAAGKPFLCYLPSAVAHTPYLVPADVRQEMMEAITRAGVKGQLAQMSRFFAMIQIADRNLGRLEDFLRESGQRDNTILVFMTDNGSTWGPQYYNAGMRGGKTTFWDGGHRVPCFVRWPAGGLRAPADVSGLAEVQDILPTLLELTGVPAPAGATFDGTSLAGVLRGTATVPDRTLVVQFGNLPNAPRSTAQGDAAVLWQNWRLVQDKELHDIAADPGQERNVLAEHPDIAAKLRAHYAAWWTDVSPRLDQPERIIVGHAAEPVSMLTPPDWRDVSLDRSREIRSGDRKNGVWFLEAAAAGDYRIELRRWPRERDAAIAAGIPAVKNGDGEFPAGVALPIASARVKVGGFEASRPVAAEDKAVVFTAKLPVGNVELQTWFDDAAGKEICGAYYVEVRRGP